MGCAGFKPRFSNELPEHRLRYAVVALVIESKPVLGKANRVTQPCKCYRHNMFKEMPLTCTQWLSVLVGSCFIWMTANPNCPYIFSLWEKFSVLSPVFDKAWKEQPSWKYWKKPERWFEVTKLWVKVQEICKCYYLIYGGHHTAPAVNLF